MASRQIRNKARLEWWSVHVEAWRRSGLSRRIYCRQHRLTEKTFGRWLVRIEGAEALRAKAELAREAKRNKAPRWSSDARSRAVQAFWAMHVEAQTWSGLSFANYAKALRVSEKSMKRWRARLEAGEIEIDWRTRLHPSAPPPLCNAASTGLSTGAKRQIDHAPLTSGPAADPRPARPAFTDEQKRAIVEACESTDFSVAEVARRHDIVPSMIFRWRAQFGYGAGQARLATVALADGAATLTDLLRAPDGMRAVELPDGRRVFAPADADAATVIAHVLGQETAR